MTTPTDTSDAIGMALLKLYDSAYSKGFQEGCDYERELRRDNMERCIDGDREA